MLSTWKMIGFIATKDAVRAREFYGGKLGLPLIDDSPFAQVFDANGTMLRVTPVGEFHVARYTVLGWEVPDIREAVGSLGSAGIGLNRYDGIGQDELGIWTAPGGVAKVAWFSDPDGNVLSVSQHF